MKAAILHDLGQAPSFGDFSEPTAGPDQAVVTVAAAGVNHLDLAKASGTFYLAPPPVPSVLGSDGVGRLADGRRVFFDASVAPYGSWAEQTIVTTNGLLDVAEGVDDAVAAALGNTGLAAWVALEWRAGLQPGETVLVLGATGALGSVAVQAAKILGAGRVVAAARSGERLDRLLTRGADATVALDAAGGDPSELSARLRDATGGADVIIDPIWGQPALAAMRAAAPRARLIQLGQMAGVEVSVPAPVLRSASLDVRGFATFNAPLEVRRGAYLRLTEHAARGDLEVDLDQLPLAEVAAAWTRQRDGAGTKLVLVP